MLLKHDTATSVATPAGEVTPDEHGTFEVPEEFAHWLIRTLGFKPVAKRPSHAAPVTETSVAAAETPKASTKTTAPKGK
jgi:hypothetical protein